MKGLTDIERVRYDIGLSIAWLTKAQGSLDWPKDGAAAAGQAKAELQAALPLVREAITDLDGLVQDEKNEADGIDPEYEAAMADRPAECPECGDPYCPVFRGA